MKEFFVKDAIKNGFSKLDFLYKSSSMSSVCDTKDLLESRLLWFVNSSLGSVNLLIFL